jgi:predicted transcriptional regulator
MCVNSQFDRFCFGLDDKSCALTTDITTLTVGGDVVKFSSKTDDELNINAQAKCLLEALANVISRLEDVAKTDQYVNTLLKRLIKFKHGISVDKQQTLCNIFWKMWILYQSQK